MQNIIYNSRIIYLMNPVRRIATNTLTLAVSEIVSKLALFAIFVYIGRIFGDVTFGKFNFAYSFALMAAMFMDIGINYMIVREIARKKDSTNKYLTNALVTKIFFSLIAIGFVFLVMNLIGKDQQTSILVYLLCIFAFARSFTELLFSAFKAHERMYYEAAIKILGMVSLLIAGIIILYNGYGIIFLSLAFAVIEILIFLISGITVHLRFQNLNLNIDLKLIKEIIIKALPFTLSMISGAVYFNIAIVILNLIKDDAAVGAFSAAFNLTTAILFIPAMYSYAIYPIFSRDYNSMKDKVILIYERSFKYLYLIGLPLTIGTFILAQKIIFTIYGTKYFSSSIAVLQILSWFIFIKFVGYLTGILLSSINKQKLRMYAQGSTAILSIILNLILIPRYSFIGAAIATVASELVLFLMTYSFASVKFHFVNILKILYKPLIASILMGVIIIILNLNLFLSFIIGSTVYIVSVILLKILDQKDYQLLSRIIKNE